MSIASPNFDKLPSRQAEIRAEKRAAEQEAVIPLEPEISSMGSRGRKTPPARRALCHPRRVAVNADGQCRVCVNARLTRIEKTDLSPEQALELVAKEGISTIGRKARAKLQAFLPEAARVFIEGAKVAAAKGDTKPAEWLLTHVPTGDEPIVRPPAKEGGGGGVRVLIGVNIGGLPGVAQAAITVPVEASLSDPSPETPSK